MTTMQPRPCEDVLFAAQALLDGERSGVTSREIQAHTADCDGCRARSGHPVSVRPVAARLFQRAAFARMLDGQEQRAAIGREFTAADFAASGAAGELLEKAALRSAGRHHVAAIVRMSVIVGVGDDPQPALRIDAEIVGAMNRAEFRRDWDSRAK